ncbi:unnamed protein product [Blumeria hordei]|uniref:Uncharacterized protein n=2 Tax=Blumeria hordei TaxID=2867405 RepID=A0A383V028_BLUHO|nr:putative U3snoRNA associated protein [Blumeria hordei DH14]SZF05963.1 unnamed protein product [Blumeria hordei]
MSAISRLYNSAKSLLSYSSNQDRSITTRRTGADSNIMQTRQNIAGLSEDMKKSFSKDSPRNKRQATTSSSKKRYTSIYHEGAEPVPSSSKRQKTSSNQPRSAEKMQTPKLYPISNKSTKYSTPLGYKSKTPDKNSSSREEDRNSETCQDISAIEKSVDTHTDTTSQKMTPAARHKRFGSEEPLTITEISTIQSEPTLAQELAAESESTDSDDDAPETFAALDSGNNLLTKLAEVAKAENEKNKAFLQKRREKKERKRQNLIELSDLIHDGVKSSPMNTTTAQGKIESEYETINDFEIRDKVQKEPKCLTERLPDLLPSEYLDDDDPPEPILSRPSKNMKSKKTIFKNLDIKQPKDIHVGNTTYRVIQKESKHLAPKVAPGARKTKENLLQRNGVRSQGSNRRYPSSGFVRPQSN